MSSLSVTASSAVATGEGFRIGSVTSKDGTAIGYRAFGCGPGVVLVHGTMSSGRHHTQLAEALGDNFTVYVPDRRGRGLSGPYRPADGIQQDVEDLQALIAATGAHNAFGLSSGAIIVLQAALTLDGIHKAAIFEPPLLNNASEPAATLRRFDREMAEGNVAAALITAMKGAQMGPPIFNLMPRWPLEKLTARYMASEARKPTNGYATMRELAPSLHYDFKLVMEASGRVDAYRGLHADLLLLGGSKSPAFLKAALDRLERAVPGARRVVFPGLDHAASWNEDRGGHPAPVARELRRFFG
jgi:pimeloyl-ACP methyl ester carboxylesterase